MESRNSWQPIHHAIEAVLRQNKEPAMLAYELVENLQKEKFLSQSVETEQLM